MACCKHWTKMVPNALSKYYYIDTMATKVHSEGNGALRLVTSFYCRTQEILEASLGGF